ncbi:hypothetical protein [Halobellus captivus]|uniref:hypothetical protein n=1 Tax=Halobellus captivus TaxID=2592614 RepID=UPI0011A9BF33|nr:hypothetical protein [Halobellus captivus]
MANARNGSIRTGMQLGLIAVLTATGGILGVAGVVAGAPGEPISFYGEATDADGDSAGVGTVIVAVVDGGVVDSITVTESGIYANDSPTAEKLRTHTNAGGTVTFHVGSADGPQADETHNIGESGVFELDLTFPAGTFAAESDDSESSDGGGDSPGGPGGGEGGAAGPGGGLGTPTTEAPQSDEGTQQRVTEDLVDSDSTEPGVQVPINGGPVEELSFDERG